MNSQKKIALLTYADDYFETILKSFKFSKLEYCQENNIEFIFIPISRDSNNKLSWRKIDILLQYIEQYDAVIITDYDSVIINTQFNIRELLEKYSDRDVICSSLDSGLKLLGCSVWYNTINTRNILYALHSEKQKDDISFLAEEAAFNKLINTMPINIALDNTINSIYNIHTCNNPFILHYAGIGNPYLIKKKHEERCNCIR